MAEDKGKYNKLSQKAYEELMDKSMKNVVKQTEKMVQARRKSWNGKIADAPAPKLEEGTKVKKEKK